MSAIIPCIWLDDQAERAAAFYAKTLPEGRVTATSHYPASTDNPSGKPRGSVLTVEFEVAGQRFTALNGGPMFEPNASISFFVNVASAADVDRIYEALLDGGEALMPIGAYPWSERYGWVKDRFGVSWQVMLVKGQDRAAVLPCLMFSDANRGKAEDAMKHYTSIFPNGRIDFVDRYPEGEEIAGKIRHARFTLDGIRMVAMDSHIAHGVTFDEGLSLQVMCKDQSEVDRYWRALGEGGEEGPCGWLKDRFGLSWQVVPTTITKWMTSNDAPARDRAFAALMKMRKLDIAALDRAFAGR